MNRSNKSHRKHYWLKICLVLAACSIFLFALSIVGVGVFESYFRKVEPLPAAPLENSQPLFTSLPAPAPVVKIQPPAEQQPAKPVQPITRLPQASIPNVTVATNLPESKPLTESSDITQVNHVLDSFLTINLPDKKTGLLPQMRDSFDEKYSQFATHMEDYLFDWDSSYPEGREKDQFNDLMKLYADYLEVCRELTFFKDKIRQEKMEPLDAWFENEVARLAQQFQENPPPGYDNNYLWKMSALRFGYSPNYHNPERSWNREVYYWRQFGGAEGHYRIAARAIENRYNSFYDRIRGSHLSKALPPQLDLD